MNKEGILGEKRSKKIEHLRGILTEGKCLMVDLDDTIKEPIKYLWNDGVTRKMVLETVGAFGALHLNGINIGVITEQSFSEIEPFLSDLTNLLLRTNDYRSLFNGLIVGEGGGVVRCSSHNSDEIRMLVSSETVAEKDKFLD